MQLSLATDWAFSLFSRDAYHISEMEVPAARSLQYSEFFTEDKHTDGEHLIIHDF